jgi:uncharacterized protein (TIGR03382 family)
VSQGWAFVLGEATGAVAGLGLFAAVYGWILRRRS